jgi:hypothetical protein
MICADAPIALSAIRSTSRNGSVSGPNGSPVRWHPEMSSSVRVTGSALGGKNTGANGAGNGTEIGPIRGRIRYAIGVCVCVCVCVWEYVSEEAAKKKKKNYLKNPTSKCSAPRQPRK